MAKQLDVDEMRNRFSQKYSESMKTMQIVIRQQNENVRLYNLYIGYNDRPLMLHSMALSSKEDARDLGFRIIEMNKGLVPQITWETY